MDYIDLRKGHVFKHEGEVYVCVENTHVTPGKGRGMTQIKMKNARTGAVVQRRFRPNDTVETVWVDKLEKEYLYHDGQHYIFMDTETYEQEPLAKELLAGMEQWLIPNIRVALESYDGTVIGVKLPDVIEYEVTETDPVVKGQTATNQYKPAIIETGAKVMVPPFISQGEKIRVDTRDGKYLERAK